MIEESVDLLFERCRDDVFKPLGFLMYFVPGVSKGFDQIELDGNHTVHLVWVRPDGKEMFRKYVDVVVREVVEQDAGSDYEAHIRWKKAEDLHYLKEDRESRGTPSFSLTANLNIATKKERVPGSYRLQVFLDRRFLMEKSFEVLPPQDS